MLDLEWGSDVLRVGFFICRKRRPLQPDQIVMKSADNVSGLQQTPKRQCLLGFSLLALKLHSNRVVASFSMLWTPILLACHRTAAQNTFSPSWVKRQHPASYLNFYLKNLPARQSSLRSRGTFLQPPFCPPLGWVPWLKKCCGRKKAFQQAALSWGTHSREVLKLHRTHFWPQRTPSLCFRLIPFNKSGSLSVKWEG